MLRIRRFRNDDPPGLVALWQESFTGRGAAPLRTAGPLERYVFAKPYFDPAGFLVAEDDGRLVGFAHAGFGPNADETAPDPSRGVVCAIAVHPAYHRHGIGTRLLLALTREAIAAGCTAMTLEVRVSNEAAQAMYRTFGYAPAGVRKNYYAETNEDALIMWAHDVDLAPYGARLDEIEATLR